MYVFMYVRMHACMYVYMYACMDVRKYACKCAYMYVYIYGYVCVYGYVCIFVYLHTSAVFVSHWQNQERVPQFVRSTRLKEIYAIPIPLWTYAKAYCSTE